MRRATITLLALLLIPGGAVLWEPTEAQARARWCLPRPPRCPPGQGRTPTSTPPRPSSPEPDDAMAPPPDEPMTPAAPRAAPGPSAPGTAPDEVKQLLRGVNTEAWLLDYVDHLVDLRLLERESRASYAQAREALGDALRSAKLARAETVNAEADERQAASDLELARQGIGEAEEKRRAAEGKQADSLADLEARERKLRAVPDQVRERGGYPQELAQAEKDAQLLLDRGFETATAISKPDTYRAWVNQLSRDGQAIVKPGFEALEVARRAVERRAEELRRLEATAERNRSLLASSKERRRTAARALMLAEMEVLEAEQEVAWAKRAVRKRGDEVTAFARTLLAEEVIPYSIAGELHFTINWYTGAVFAELDSGLPGERLDADDTRALFQGRLRRRAPSPSLMVAYAVGATRWLETDTYRERRKAVYRREGAAYYASHRFVRWAGAASALRKAAQQMPQGEAGTRQALEMIRLEYHDLVAWLALQGTRDLESTASALLLAALQGTRIDLPNLSAGPEALGTRGRTVRLGTSFLPKFLRNRYARQHAGGVVREEGVAAGEVMAFGVRWRGEPTPPAALLARFDEQRLSGRRLVSDARPGVFAAVAEGLGDRTVAQALVEPSATVVSLDERALEALGVTESTLRPYFIPGSQLIDLRGSPIATQVEALFRGAAIGSRGRVEVDALELDLRTYRMSGRLRVVHEDSWGTLETLLD